MDDEYISEVVEYLWSRNPGCTFGIYPNPQRGDGVFVGLADKPPEVYTANGQDVMTISGGRLQTAINRVPVAADCYPMQLPHAEAAEVVRLLNERSKQPA